MRKLYGQSDSDDQKAQIQIIEQAFRQPMTQAVQQELNAIHKAKLQNLALFDTLDRIYIRHDLGKRLERSQLETDEEVVPIVVSSLGMITE